jgi:hypothetical protein
MECNSELLGCCKVIETIEGCYKKISMNAKSPYVTIEKIDKL